MLSSTAVVGIVVMVVMIVMILLGFPVFLSMLATAIFGFYYIGGDIMAATQMTTGIYNISASYTFAVIPMFMIVGVLAADTKIADKAFEAMQIWLCRIKGGLLYAIVFANAIFGACSGTSSAGNILFSKLAMPSLKARNYDESMSYGVICSSGTLGVLIPPSIPCIVLCLMTNLSIGSALMHCLAGGFLMIVVLCLSIFLIQKIKPSKTPPKGGYEEITWRDRLATLKLLAPVLFLFALIVVGTFLGWFSATVGGAVAAVVIMLYAVFARIPIKAIAKSFWNASQMFVSIFLILVAGSFFARFVTLSGMAAELAAMIRSLDIAPFLIFLIIYIFYIFSGCFMHMMSMIIITIPVVFPLLTGLGYDPYVLCVVLIFVLEIGGLSPPVGMNVFAVSNVMNVPATRVFRGVLPFFLIDCAVGILILVFPFLVTWLPALLA